MADINTWAFTAILTDPQKTFRLHLTTVGYAQNPLEDAFLFDTDKLNKASETGSYSDLLSNSYKDMQLAAYESKNGSEISMFKRNIKIQPITVVTKASATVFTVSAGDALRIKAGLALSFVDTTAEWVIQYAMVTDVTGTTITLASPWFTGFVVWSKFKLGAFSKTTWVADAISTGQDTQVEAQSNFIQIEERQINLVGFANRNRTLLRTDQSQWLDHQVSQELVNQKLGLISSFYTATKSNNNNKPTAWGIADFIAAAHTHIIAGGDARSCMLQLANVIAEQQRSGISNVKTIWVCTTSFYSQLAAYRYNLGDQTTVTQGQNITYAGIKLETTPFSVCGYSAEFAVSSMLDYYYENQPICLAIPVSHVSQYVYTNTGIDVANDKASFEKGVNRVKMRRKAKETVDNDTIMLSTNFSWLGDGYLESIYKKVYMNIM